MRAAENRKIQDDSAQYLELFQNKPLTYNVEVLPGYQQQLTTLQKYGYYLLIAAFLFGGVQAVRCSLDSGVKLDALLKQLVTVQTAETKTKMQNALLEDKISLYSSPLGIEEIARERLDMVGKDEILVRVYPAAVVASKE